MDEAKQGPRIVRGWTVNSRMTKSFRDAVGITSGTNAETRAALDAALLRAVWSGRTYGTDLFNDTKSVAQFHVRGGAVVKIVDRRKNGRVR